MKYPLSALTVNGKVIGGVLAQNIRYDFKTQTENQDMRPTDAQTSEDLPSPRITARQAKGLLANVPRVSEPESAEEAEFLAAIAEDDQATKPLGTKTR